MRGPDRAAAIAEQCARYDREGLGDAPHEEALRDIGDFLLDPSCQCQPSEIRCDAFDVEKGDERPGVNLVSMDGALLGGTAPAPPPPPTFRRAVLPPLPPSAN